MIQLQSFFVLFLFQVCLEISLVNCQHKKTTKITSSSPNITTQRQTTTISIPAYCNYTECEAKTEQYCLCPELNYQNHSYNWLVPKNDTCPSIGCSLSGKNCYCQMGREYDYQKGRYYDYFDPYAPCKCFENKCNQTECAGRSLFSGCYCYFGDKEIWTSDMPASKNCSDLFKEIGNNKGQNQCSQFLCNCDKYGDCVCKAPKNKNPQIPKPKECNSEHCGSRSFEFCKCSYSNCSTRACINNVVFKKLPKTGVCSGMLNSSYQCSNIGQKCSCKNDCDGIKSQYKVHSTKKSECVCVDVDPLYYSGDCSYCKSYGSCICNYGEFAVLIPNYPKNCKALEKSQTPNTTKFDACPYREGPVCECKQNPNTGKKQCYCQYTLDQIPPFNLRPNPYVCCKDVSDCIEHSELYCYCTNYANNTYVKKVSRSAISKLPKHEYDYKSVEKLCYAYGHPPNISCHTFGYIAYCVQGYCSLKQTNLYYSNY